MQAGHNWGALMPNWMQALLGVFGVSLLSLIGVVTVKLDEAAVQRLIPPALAVAVGALLGDAFLHMLPQSYGALKGPATSGLLVLFGMLTFFALEQFLSRHRHGHPTNDVLPIGPMSIAANSVHNVVDGVMVGGAFLTGSRVGIATLLAVALHEIPHEAANYGVLLHANYGRRRAIYVNFFVGLAAMAGVIVALAVGAHAAGFASGMLPFTAGCFLYMACADLMPSLLKERRASSALWTLLLIVAGVMVMLALLFTEAP